MTAMSGLIIAWSSRESQFDRRREDEWDLGRILEGRVI